MLSPTVVGTESWTEFLIEADEDLQLFKYPQEGNFYDVTLKLNITSIPDGATLRIREDKDPMTLGSGIYLSSGKVTKTGNYSYFFDNTLELLLQTELGAVGGFYELNSSVSVGLTWEQGVLSKVLGALGNFWPIALFLIFFIISIPAIRYSRKQMKKYEGRMDKMDRYMDKIVDQE